MSEIPKHISLFETSRKISLLYPALNPAAVSRAIEELKLPVVTKVIYCLKEDDFDKLREYLSYSEVRHRLHQN
jgi:hypothetical protein